MDALKYVSQILDDADSWETMMFLYDAALRQMSTKIDILNEEFIHIHNWVPLVPRFAKLNIFLLVIL